MANHKSAQKRAVQNQKKNKRNRSYLSSVRTAVKKFQQGLLDLKTGTVDAVQAQKLFSQAQSALGKAVSKGLIHKNNVSRKVSRMTSAFKTITK